MDHVFINVGGFVFRKKLFGPYIFLLTLISLLNFTKYPVNFSVDGHFASNGIINLPCIYLGLPSLIA